VYNFDRKSLSIHTPPHRRWRYPVRGNPSNEPPTAALTVGLARPYRIPFKLPKI